MPETSQHILKIINQAKKEKSKSLSLVGQGLTEIPAEVFELDFLEELDLSYNEIQTIPKAVSRLKELRQINFAGNPVSEAYDILGLILDFSIYQKLAKKISEQVVTGIRLEKQTNVLGLPVCSFIQQRKFLCRQSLISMTRKS